MGSSCYNYDYTCSVITNNLKKRQLLRGNPVLWTFSNVYNWKRMSLFILIQLSLSLFLSISQSVFVGSSLPLSHNFRIHRDLCNLWRKSLHLLPTALSRVSICGSVPDRQHCTRNTLNL